LSDDSPHENNNKVINIINKYFILKLYQTKELSTNTGVGDGGLVFINYYDNMRLCYYIFMGNMI